MAARRQRRRQSPQRSKSKRSFGLMERFAPKKGNRRLPERTAAEQLGRVLRAGSLRLAAGLSWLWAALLSISASLLASLKAGAASLWARLQDASVRFIRWAQNKPPPRARRAKKGAPPPKKKAAKAAKKKAPKKKRAPKRPATNWEEVQLVPAPLRIRLIAAIFALASTVLIARAIDLQIVQGPRYAAQAARQSSARRSVGARRGQIKDRNGQLLAATVDLDSVYAQPQRVQDLDATIAALAPVLKLRKSELRRRLRPSRRFSYLRRRVDAETAEAVRALKLPGVGTVLEPKRYYPNVRLAAHALGFTNYAGEGRAGVERVLNKELTGKSASSEATRDARGRRVFTDPIRAAASLRGGTVELSLDSRVQHVAEIALEETVRAHRAKAGTAIVMLPKTGELLAVANYPSYNPNNLGQGPAANRKDLAVSAVFDPGSTMKIVTVAEALEKGLANPNTVMNCENGKFKVGVNTIRDGGHRYDKLTVSDVLQKSSNICAAKLGLALGRRRLGKALADFGFGEKTGVELSGEVRGLIRPSARWRDIDLATISFGQGLAVTAMQVIQAASAIANDGLLLPPRIVRAVTPAGGARTPSPRAKGRRVVSARTARQLREMMQRVTEEGGTAQQAAIPGLRVSGKTGTAQKLDPATRRYSRELYVASFVGFVPAEDPEVVVLVAVDEPREGSYYGGVVAGPAFKKIALAALATRGVFPKEAEEKQNFLAQYQRLPQLDPPKGAAEAGVGLDAMLSPEALKLLGEGAPAPVKTARAGARRAGQMPDLSGLSLRQVLVELAQSGCDPVIKGTGWVVSQAPRAGAKLKPGDRCALTLGLSAGRMPSTKVGRSAG